MSTSPHRLSRLAVASLVLGLAALLLFGVTGIPALVLGVLGLRAINRADGRLRGRRLALAGMALGAAGTVITTVGIAAMLLLYAHTQARRNECANNLRRIGQGVNRFYDLRGEHFPRAVVPNAALPPAGRLSWLAAILPYLDEGTRGQAKWSELADRIDYQAGWAAAANAEATTVFVPVFLCPAHPRFNPRHKHGLTCYVGIAGIDPDAAELPVTSPRAGVFGFDRLVARQDLTRGISFTLLAVETTRDNGFWVAGGRSTVRGLDPDETAYVGPGRPFGGLHHGGMNALYADTSVRFVPDTIPAAQLRRRAVIHLPPEAPGD